MKNLFKEAHRMTREMMKKYNDIDYSAQFTLCLEYLRKEDKDMIKAELKGTEKQIKWAEDIRSNFIKIIEESKEKYDKADEIDKKDLRKAVKRRFFYGTYKKASKDKDVFEFFIEKAEKLIEEQTKAEYYINNRDIKNTHGLIIIVAAEYPEGITTLKESVKNIEEAKEEYKNATGKEFDIVDTDKLIEAINGNGEVPEYFTEIGKKLIEETKENNRKSNFVLSCIIEDIATSIKTTIAYPKKTHEENIEWFKRMIKNSEKHYS